MLNLKFGFIDQLTNFAFQFAYWVCALFVVFIIIKTLLPKKKKNRRFDTDIIVVVGDRGNGKSTWLSLYGIQKKKEGLNVYANSWYDWTQYLKGDELRNIFYFEDVIDMLDMRKGAMLCDEAALHIASRRWWLLDEDAETAIVLSRHIEMDLIWLAICFKDVNNYVRDKCDYVVYLHKTGIFGWWTQWRRKDLDDKGKRLKLKFPKDWGFILHTKKIHSTYDDRALFGALLADRPVRNWYQNGTSINPPAEYIPPKRIEKKFRHRASKIEDE